MEESMQTQLLQAECKLMLTRLRDLGFESTGDQFIDLSLPDLLELRRQLRDLLRTLGGK